MHKAIIRHTDGQHEVGVFEGGKYIFTAVDDLDDLLNTLINTHKMPIFDIAELLKDEVIRAAISEEQPDTSASLTFPIRPLHPPLTYTSPSSVGALLATGTSLTHMFDYLANYYLADFSGKFRKAYAELLGSHTEIEQPTTLLPQRISTDI